MLATQIEGTEALCREIDHFLHCIDTTEPERSGGAGLRVVEIMRPASQSMARLGTSGGVTTHFPADDGIDQQ